MTIDPPNEAKPSRLTLPAVARPDEAAGLREALAAELGLTEVRWTDHNLSRMFRATGERPARVEYLRQWVNALGEYRARREGPRWAFPGWGVWDHGELWACDGTPCVLVGHPYHLDELQRATLSRLAREFPRLRVAIDDRPSYYGFGTHHVRIEVPDPMRPFRTPRSTRVTRAVVREFRKAMAANLD